MEIPIILGIGLCKSQTLKYKHFSDQITIDHINHIKNKIFGTSLDNDFTEFQVENHHIYLYKIDSDYTFLTLLLHDNNVIKSFRAKQLQEKFKTDINTTIQLFQEISNQPSDYSFDPLAISDKDQELTQSHQVQQPPKIEEDINIEEALAALNSLSKFICRYLGPKITSNFLNITQPNDDWINQFEIKYSAVVTFRGNPNEIIKPLNILLLRNWTQNFMKKCYQLIRDLPDKFEREGLCEKHRKIISIYTSDYLNLENSSSYDQREGLFSNLVFENQSSEIIS